MLAVAALATSTLVIGIASWFWLSRTNSILEELHNTTLSEVNRSHELTKQSALFTASAPYLLNLRSSYLVQSEGNKLLQSIDVTIDSWQSRFTANEDTQIGSSGILDTLLEMRKLVELFISQSATLSKHDDSTRVYAAKLGLLDKRLVNLIRNEISNDQLDATRQAQLAVQKLVSSSNANSLLSLGEHQRVFLSLTEAGTYKNSLEEVQNVVNEAVALATGPEGLFKTRFKALQSFVSAHALLGNIGSKANELNDQVLRLIKNSQSEIARRRDETSENIRYAKYLVALFCIGSIVLSLFSAFYISGDIIKRLKNITISMAALANGNLNLRRPEKVERNDELAALQKAFNIFHSNAIEHNEVHTELIQKTALFESTFNNINDGVAITNKEGRLLAHNPKLNILLSQFGSKSDASIGCILADRVESVNGDLRESNQFPDGDAYHEIRNSLGNSLEIRTSVLPDGGSVWLFSDTTERRRVEERLQHFQRLESLGQLTGEVAHDVNNILSAVKATLPSVISKRGDQSEHQAAVDNIEDAVDLGNSLTQRLLAFARKQRLEPQLVELNDLVNGVSDLISLSLGNDIQLKIVNSSLPLTTFIDPLQLESALLNLCMNSAHAIEGVGEVKIVLEKVKTGLLCIRVKDNGCGMNRDTIDRAVEPFFSTRRNGNGTGLGLSIVYGFIKQSGGDMHIESAEGSGTEVTLVLNEADSKLAVNAEKPNFETLIAKKSVLVVEDDPVTLERAVRLFENLAYKVTPANSYEEAWRILSGSARFSLLFTDLHLGIGRTGWELASLCISQHLVDQVIVTSGKRSDLASPPIDLKNQCNTLEKPYQLEDVAQLV